MHHIKISINILPSIVLLIFLLSYPTKTVGHSFSTHTKIAKPLYKQSINEHKAKHFIPDSIVKASPAYTSFLEIEIGTGIINIPSPTVADLDNDGTNELLIATTAGKIYILDKTGGLQQEISVNNRKIIAQLALGDLDKDGDLEIVAGVSNINVGQKGEVYVWHHDGTPFSGWPQQVARFGNAQESLISTVVLADIDGDSDLEIIAGTNNNLVGTSKEGSGLDVPDLYVWHHNGNLVTGNWPAEDSPAIKGHIAVGDLDLDTKAEIVTARDYNQIFAYDNQGNDLTNWPIQTFVPFNGSNATKDDRITHKLSGPALADLDGDGSYEYVVAGLRTKYNSSTPINNDLLVYQVDGTRRTGWETPAGGSGVLRTNPDMHQTPAIGDLNNDSLLDIVVPTQDGKIRAYAPDKTLLWQFNYAKGNFIYSSEPVIGDVDNDGFNEVVFGTYDPNLGNTDKVGVWVLEHDGSVKGGGRLLVDAPGVRAAPTLADLDGNGTLDIVAVTSRRKIYAWDTGVLYNIDKLPWPMGRHDLRRTGFYDANSFNARKLSPGFGDLGNELKYTIHLVRTGPSLTDTIQLTDTLPLGLTYVPNSLTATHGITNDSLAPTLHWNGYLSETSLVEISYQVAVTETSKKTITNFVRLYTNITGNITRTATLIANPDKVFLPIILK